MNFDFDVRLVVGYLLLFALILEKLRQTKIKPKSRKR